MVEALSSSRVAIATLSDEAARDPLTQLPNRRGFERELAAATAAQRAMTLMFLDLDDFKPVNDLLGHAAGDLVLRAVSGRIRRCLREGDVASRLGGDEFGIILQRDCSDEEARSIALRIVDAVSAPIDMGTGTVTVGCCVGVASWPMEDKTPAEALEAADRGLYSAKRAGKRSVRLASDANAI